MLLVEKLPRVEFFHGNVPAFRNWDDWVFFTDAGGTGANGNGGRLEALHP